MRRNSFLAVSLMLLFAGRMYAKEAVESDSVIVMGLVVDHLTNEPQPYCLLYFLQGTDTAATVSCDEKGYFATDRLLAGRYTLSATLKGQQVYQADLVLNDNIVLSIAVITDSFYLRNLHPVEVNAMKHLLGEQQIATLDDIRLWNLTMRKGGGDHNASVSISPDMEPEMDALDVQNGVLRLLLPVGIPASAYKYYLTDFGLKVSPKNSAMKNELLREGRILNTKRHAPADTNSSRHEKK